MLRLSTNELSGLLSNLDLNFNILVFTFLFIIFSITRIKRLKSSKNSFDTYDEVFRAIKELLLVPVLIQIILKFLFIIDFGNDLSDKEILLVIGILLAAIIKTINQGLASDIVYLYKNIIKLLQKKIEESHHNQNVTENNRLSYSQNLEISNISEKKEKDTEDISEDEPPQ